MSIFIFLSLILCFNNAISASRPSREKSPRRSSSGSEGNHSPGQMTHKDVQRLLKSNYIITDEQTSSRLAGGSSGRQSSTFPQEGGGAALQEGGGAGGDDSYRVGLKRPASTTRGRTLSPVRHRQSLSHARRSRSLSPVRHRQSRSPLRQRKFALRSIPKQYDKDFHLLLDVDDDGFTAVELSHNNTFSLNHSSTLVPLRGPFKRVGKFTTRAVLDALRYAKASYKYINAGLNPNIKELTGEGSVVHFISKLDEKPSRMAAALENQDTALFVEKTDRTAVLAFKGSDRLNTWLSNFTASTIESQYKTGKYHTGFFSMYKHLEEQIWDRITKWKDKHNYTIKEALKKLVVTGHSRGGAAAIIFSDRARRYSGVSPKTITFGAPRALTNKTAIEYDKYAGGNTLNISQVKDPVHYLVFSSITGLSHVGLKLYLPLDTAYYPHILNGYESVLCILDQFEEVSEYPSDPLYPKYKFEAYDDPNYKDLTGHGEIMARDLNASPIALAIDGQNNTLSRLRHHAQNARRLARDASAEAGETVSNVGTRITNGATSAIAKGLWWVTGYGKKK